LRKKLWYIGIFAVAMAYLESAVVVYLRRIYNITDLTTSLSRFDSQISSIEVGREVMTLIMLLAVGWTVGKNFQSRVGFAIFTFGLWDIFYYIWLRVFIGWPTSLFNSDLLFLIPLPWWGPVMSPILIALLMMLSGERAVLFAERGTRIHFRPLDWTALTIGVLIILYSFMADSLTLLPANLEMLSEVKPTAFNWLLYMIGFALVVFSVYRVTRHGEDCLGM